MSGLNTTNPIISGNIRAVYDASTAINDTNWHNLTSADFKDTTTGNSCAAGLKLMWIGITNEGSTSMHIKYRAKTLSTDPTTNEIAVGQFFSDDICTLVAVVRTIAIKKAAAGDVVQIVAGFATT
tara:strand:- start:506 stop:880 length:375 start_codon:yes stop_codon:yes gene_type:complete